jgi:hypothetical protein
MRSATAAAFAIQSDGIPFEPLLAAQLVKTALLDQAIPKYQEAFRIIPFVHDTPAGPGQWTAWDHKLHERSVIDEAKEMLRRRQHNGKVLDDISLEAMAVRVAAHIKEQVLHHGLHVYFQKWLFDPSQSLERRLAVLQQMAHPVFGPQSASVAIASGRMPALPAYTVADFVRMLDSSWKRVSFAVPNDDIKGWVAATKPSLVEFPAPNIEAGKAARTDRISVTSDSERIELGLGFFLVEEDAQLDLYRVVTPMLFAGRKTGLIPTGAKYSKNYQYESFSRHHVNAHKQLAMLLRAPERNKIARLEVCANCGTIFSKDRTDLAHAGCKP